MRFTAAAVVGLVLASLAGCAGEETASSGNEAELAQRLLDDGDVAAVFPELSSKDYSTGSDYGLIRDGEFDGATESASRGVVRQWSQPYSWSVGDAVRDLVIAVMATAIAFDTPADAQAAAAAVSNPLHAEGAESPSQSASSRFEVVMATPGTGPETRSVLATATDGPLLVVIQIEVVGNGGHPSDIDALVAAAETHLP